MRLAFTADLHYGLRADGDRSTERLVRRLQEIRPDLLVLAGDTGTGENLRRCLRLFAELPCPKFLIAGNHCLWTDNDELDSLTIYQRRLPSLAEECGFWYLDAQPWVDPQRRLALVGSVNWYDYSFAPAELAEQVPDLDDLYRRKRFPGGARHNDGRFVRMPLSDKGFTGLVVDKLAAHLRAVETQASDIVAVLHHPPFPELFFPWVSVQSPTPDQMTWLAYTGNLRMDRLLRPHPHVRLVVCGHTHRSIAADVEGKRCFNIGGDYDRKRLLLVEWPGGHHEWMDG